MDSEKLVNEIIKKLKGQIFKRRVAMTINIAGGMLVNRRKWKNYDTDQQRDILERIARTYGERYGYRIDYEHFQYEWCKIGTVHLHFVVITSRSVEKLIKDCNERIKSPEGYSVFYGENIFDDDGWDKYIRKNIKSDSIEV